MESWDELTQGFKAKYGSFLSGCDAIEESGGWNKEAHGEKDVFYENELLGQILRLIAPAGEICGKEVAYVNRNFGFEQTPERLKAAYENCYDRLGESYDESYG